MMRVQVKYQIRPLLAIESATKYQLDGPGIKHVFKDLKEALGAQEKLNMAYAQGYAEGCGAGIDADFQALVVETMNLLDELGCACAEQKEMKLAAAYKGQAEKLRAALKARGVLPK